jgi:hypothetical protein
MSSIACSCGQCSLTLADNNPIMSLYCECKDCAQAIKWGEFRGGKASQKLTQAVYARSDIVSVEGENHMKPFQLRNPAKSTRVYCINCYSILGINHPAYSNNVFMFFPYHCEADLDLSIKPCAAIHMSSYPYDEKANIPNGIPVFHNWDYSQERDRFLSIPDVGKAFRKPLKPSVGKSFEELIVSLGDIEVLNLEIGADPY